MIPIIRYHHAAEDELLAEIAFLERRVPGLGRRFYAEVKRAEKFLEQFPESAAELAPDIRQHRLHKFPFSLLYTVQHDGLLILAVAHHRRRPQYWIGRIPSQG